VQVDAIAAAAETASMIAATDPKYCSMLLESGLVESILHAVGNVSYSGGWCAKCMLCDLSRESPLL